MASDLEGQMVSVERIAAFSRMPQVYSVAYSVTYIVCIPCVYVVFGTKHSCYMLHTRSLYMYTLIYMYAHVILGGCTCHSPGSRSALVAQQR